MSPKVIWFLLCIFFPLFKSQSLSKFMINSSHLSIFSAILNPTTSHSKWIQRIFGHHAVFHPRKAFKTSNQFLDSKRLSSKEIYNRLADYKHMSKNQLRHQDLWPSCSFEFLGYAKLNVEEPITSSTKYQYPSDGKGTIKFNILANMSSNDFPADWLTWDCHYRALYENWREETKHVSPHFWPVVFYCPARSLSDCMRLNKDIQENFRPLFESTSTHPLSHHYPRKSKAKVLIRVSLEMQLKTQIWRSKFDVNLSNLFAVQKFLIPFPKRIHETRSHSSSKSPLPPLLLPTATASSSYFPSKPSSPPPPLETLNDRIDAAVCMAIPYISSDASKPRANGVMILEWIRYYRALGFHKILVFDRGGGHRPWVFEDSSYSKRQPNSQNFRKFLNDSINKDYGPVGNDDASDDDGKDWFVDPSRASSLSYFNYTIRELLDPSSKEFLYDNNEAQADTELLEYSRRSRKELQGHDKTHTFTFCRFEAKALWGIEDVLVADFDEFLYCSPADPSASSQRAYLRRFIFSKKHLGIEQLLLTQRIVANLSSIYGTHTIQECVAKQVGESPMGKGLAVGLGSIFDCFAPYEFYVGSHSVKSIHLGHVCPLTGYHQSCGYADSPRAYDCLCTSQLIPTNHFRPFQRNIQDRECSFVHLSTNENSYINPLFSYSESQIQHMALERSELWKVSNN